MGRKDSLTKKYMKNPTIFADFFNGYLYNGEPVIDPDSLSEMDTANIAIIPYTKGNKTLTVQKYRDIIKQAIVMKSSNSFFVLFGIENQSDIHYAMPVRNMLYNALTYYEQVEKITAYNKENGIGVDETFLSGYTKEDKLIPVVTITLYWGEKSWDAPTSLRDMLLETDETILPFVDNVNCNLFSIIDTQEFPIYKTELNELFSLLKSRNDGDAIHTLVTLNERFKHVSKNTAEIMRDFVNIKLPRKNKDGDYDMCKAILDLEKKNQLIGADKALVESIRKIMKNGRKSFEQACMLLELSDKDINKYKKMI